MVEISFLYNKFSIYRVIIDRHNIWSDTISSGQQYSLYIATAAYEPLKAAKERATAVYTGEPSKYIILFKQQQFPYWESAHLLKICVTQ